MTNDEIHSFFENLEKPENLCLAVAAGSHAYGLANENSDLDIRGVYLSSPESLLSETPSETICEDDSDTLYHPLAKFLKLAAAGNPNVLEWLFVKPEHILYQNEFGARLLENRHLFLSKKAIKSYSGFSAHSRKDLEKKITKINADIESRYRNPDPDELYKLEKQGRHIYRLNKQLLQALETGDFCTWIGEVPAVLKKDEKSGKIFLDPEYLEILAGLEKDVETAAVNTKLPEVCDSEKIRNLHIGINLDFLRQSLPELESSLDQPAQD